MSQDTDGHPRESLFHRAPRTLLFLRDFHGLTGGHLKVWHYFRHTAQAAGFVPKVYFTPESRLDASNPWVAAGVVPEPHWRPDAADAIFLGGMDWRWVDGHAAGTASRPVLNIIQGLRHADPADPRHAYLARPAIRLSVNPLIRQALDGVPDMRGPVLDVPMGLDLAPDSGERSESGGVVIAALKDVPTGRTVANRLRSAGIAVQLLDAPLPRARFLATIAAAEVLVCLPKASEGFYLPALEGMALGRIVICPDCRGNRIYLRHAENALVPAAHADALVAAVHDALRLEGPARARMREAALATAAPYSLQAERDAFHRVLGRIDQLWKGCA